MLLYNLYILAKQICIDYIAKWSLLKMHRLSRKKNDIKSAFLIILLYNLYIFVLLSNFLR